ncbi:MAG: RNase adapter RapZ [Microbacteriaceae bacterium]|nr:RNase adapter RapZ [Microbacteriaceae bacterium]
MSEPIAESTQELLVVTGMSGAGRSTVANTLEDIGWYVVDNLPLGMLKPLVEVAQKSEGTLPKMAVVIDVRSRDQLSQIGSALKEIGKNVHVRIVFLDATDEVLVQRYESVRRPHPLMGHGSLIDGIQAERERLRELRGISDFVLDTSRFNVHDLVLRTHEIFSEQGAPKLRLIVQSFGFKYGTPSDADMMIDMRFLPNPFWQPELRNFTGADPKVREYVTSQPGFSEFIAAYTSALEHVFAGYQRENKPHANLAVGCTGGKHRSVATAIVLSEILEKIDGVQVSLKHRDMGRE